MINKNDISTIHYTSLIELYYEFYQVYTIKNLKQRTLEHFEAKGMDIYNTTQSDWQEATNYIMKLRDDGILSKYFETVEQQIFNTSFCED
jgi:hypothetical protein